MAQRSEAIHELLQVMARLRAPDGCPWDREQDHMSLRRYAVEEVYELLDAIEAGDDRAMADELGDVLLQVVFHCQMAEDRGAFDFDAVCRGITEKLVRRHPHVFGETTADTADAVVSQWEQIKRSEKGETVEPASILSRIPRHLPALLQAEKFLRKSKAEFPCESRSPADISRDLLSLVAEASAAGLSAEELLREELKRRDH